MITMLKTRDKALISLTALFQAALGIFGFLRMLVRKEIFVMKMISGIGVGARLAVCRYIRICGHNA